jgi:acyl-CoA hydrolase
MRKFFEDCVTTNEQALEQIVKTGAKIASGFATSEPHTFYESLWKHIQKNDITDLTISQALFMAPHQLCLGEALSSTGIFSDLTQSWSGPFLKLIKKVNLVTKKLEGLSKLIDHYKELQERKIVFNSPFIGAATNVPIPENALTRGLYPDFVGRNTTRMGITDMQSIHFPDAVNSMAYTSDGRPMVEAFVAVLTPPNQDGFMSNGPANGANQEILERILEEKSVKLLLYVNPDYPFTNGYGDAKNMVHIEQFKGLAEAGKLLVVNDTGKIPSLPKGSFDNPSKIELAIAKNLVNHIEMNKDYTYGRALQVGIGATGVQAINLLKDSDWYGRIYTEMLEPFTLELLEKGKISGSHFIEKDGRRTQLDDKIVCTFSLGEDGNDFYKRIDNNPAVVMAAASRVVIPEGFYHGLGINNCLGIDFHGHVVSGGRYENHHSGIGGQAMIMRGLARGGVAYLCLKSTHTTPEGKLRSSIFPYLPKGTPISLIGPDLMGGREDARIFLVTEHGVAPLSGRSQARFIKEIIEVAHPDFKDWLRKRAYDEFRVKI